MRNLIRNQDLKTLFQGMSVAVVAGLLMGAVAHPQLQWDEVEGPQMLASGGGPRGVQTVSDPGLGAYAGRVPEYVVGTDWTRPRPEPVWWDARAEAEPEPDLETEAARNPVVVYAAHDEPMQMQARRAAWRDEPREPAYYPSDRGGAVYEADLPDAPPPPEGPEDLEADLG